MLNTVMAIVAAFATPLGAVILVAGLLAIAGLIVWAFYDGDGEQRVDGPAISAQSQMAPPPPLLSPSLFKGSASVAGAEDNTLRNLLIGLLVLVVVLVSLKLVFDSSSSSGAQASNRAEETQTAENTAQTDDASAINMTAGVPFARGERTQPICDDAFIDPPFNTQYKMCALTQAARFDRIGLSRNGVEVYYPQWKNGSDRVVVTREQPVPFTFDNKIEMIAGPDTDINQYDAYLVIGIVEDGVAPDEAKVLGANRAFAVGRYVLDKLRGETSADCQTNGHVYALSLGGHARSPARMPSTSPVLVGVKFDRRFSNFDLDVLVQDFLQSKGVEITGYNLDEFEPQQLLFTEKVCARA